MPCLSRPLSATLALVLSAVSAAAQTVEGTVTSGGEPVPFASVRIVGSASGTAADADGRFRLRLPSPGPVVLDISALGYAAQRRTVTVGADATVRLDVVLTASDLDADAVVVTGTMDRVGVRASPVKVEVLPARFLESVPSVNVLDALARVNGLAQQIDCGVCYTSSLRIHGMDGPYTAVLIDGMPVMSSLAAVYGLQGISPMLIRQVEVVKGPMSTLYGADALGGVVNILTKSPETTPRLTAHAYAGMPGEGVLEVAAVPMRGRTGLLVSGTLARAAGFRDRNGDGFSDRPTEARVALFAKGTRLDRHGFERASVVAKVYAEDRAAGVRAFVDDVAAQRGSPSVYGEAIATRRAEVLATFVPHPDVRLSGSAAVHRQRSFYGSARYDASQTDAFTQALWNPPTDGGAFDDHDVLAGIAVRALRYDDGSAATGAYDAAGRLVENRPDLRLVPGVFVQDDWQTTRHVRLLGGLRVDVQRGVGAVVSPRAALRWQPVPTTTVRVNTGTGFRLVNLFTEEHAAYTGGRATLVLEALRPERSRSVAASVQQIVGEDSPVVIDVDAFWTVFSNKIEPDYSVPGEIRYANLDGHATTRGVAVQVQGTMADALHLTVGGTLLDATVRRSGQTRAVEFAPRTQGTATLAWEGPGHLALDYTARLTGPMTLPAYAPATAAAYRAATGAPLRSRSPVYTVHSLQVSKEAHLRSGVVQGFVSVENVLDYRQSSPIVGAGDGVPGFGETFDTAYVYGPIDGRRVRIGLRLTRL